MQYFYGFNEYDAFSQSQWLDNIEGEGGTDEHSEYSLGTIDINNGQFDMWFGNGDSLSGQSSYYGIAWIRLIPENSTESPVHYIIDGHPPGETIPLNAQIAMPSIIPDIDSKVVVVSDNNDPVLITKPFGTGRAVQWGSYDFLDIAVKGPMYGLDDLIWAGKALLHE